MSFELRQELRRRRDQRLRAAMNLRYSIHARAWEAYWDWTRVQGRDFVYANYLFKKFQTGAA